MEYFKLKNLFLILSIFWINHTYALIQTKLKMLSTKTNVNDLRAISNDGKYTYFQNSNGQLLLSSNYEFKVLLKDVKSTQYHVKQGKLNNILISKNNSFLTNYNINKNHDLYLTKTGSDKVTYIGKGLNAKFIANDKYYTYFNAVTQTLNVINTNNNSLNWKIKFQKKLNPYFIPQVEFYKKNEILFTALNKNGNSTIIKYNLLSKSSKILFIAKSFYINYEMCFSKNKLIIGSFSSNNYKKSNIFEYDSSGKSSIYQSNTDDLGNLICSGTNQLYFIKSKLNKEKGNISKTSEVYKIDLNKKNYKAEKLSDLNYVRQITKIGNAIIIPFHNKFFVLEGLSDFTKFDKIKK